MNEEMSKETSQDTQDKWDNPLLPDPNLTYQEYLCRRIVLSGQLFGVVDIPEPAS